jgi:hypothetical protein
MCGVTMTQTMEADRLIYFCGIFGAVKNLLKTSCAIQMVYKRLALS